MTPVFDRLLSMFETFLAGADSPVVDRFLAGIDWRMPPRPLAPARLPCLRHLDRAAQASGEPARPLAALLAAHRADLHWGQTYSQADFGRHFIDNYGWLEVFGTRGHFANDSIAGGFLVLGPGILYPDHHHLAEEIYIPLTGATEWRMGDEAFAPRAAGDIIHHASNVNHAMRTGAEPLLALYLWRGGPLAARSTVTGTAGGR